MSLGSRINEIRKEQNLSVDDLCARSGIPKGTLSKITAGITTSPTLDTVRAIANALECRLDDLDDNPKKADFLSIDEQGHLKKYRSLDPYGKEAVDSILDIEHKRCTEAKRPMIQAAARGGGVSEIEEILPDEVPDEEIIP